MKQTELKRVDVLQNGSLNQLILEVKVNTSSNSVSQFNRKISNYSVIDSFILLVSLNHASK